MRNNKPAPVQTVKEVTERELQELFLNAPGSPLFKAVLAVVEAMNECLDERLSDGALRQRGGKISGLVEVRAELEEREVEARPKQMELQKPGSSRGIPW
jgi:hypothetical protein